MNIRYLAEPLQHAESLHWKAEVPSTLFKATQQQVASGIPLTSLFSFINCAANPGPLEGLGSLCTAQRSTREGEWRAKIQPQAMNPGLGLLPGGRDTFCNFSRNTVYMCWGDPYPTPGRWVTGVISYLKHSSSRTRSINLPTRYFLTACHLPSLPSSSDLSYSKHMQQNLLSDGGSPCIFLTARSWCLLIMGHWLSFWFAL